MPLYEYTCRSCGSREEKLETLSAPHSHDCPACGQGAGMRRQLSTAAVAVAGETPSCATGACPFAR